MLCKSFARTKHRRRRRWRCPGAWPSARAALGRVGRRRRHGSRQLRERARRGRAKGAAGGADAAAAGWSSGLAGRRAEDGACTRQMVVKQATPCKHEDERPSYVGCWRANAAAGLL